MSRSERSHMPHQASARAEPSVPTPAAAAASAWRSALALFALCLVAMVAKSPDALVNPQFWAEDGAIFFQQQQGHDLPQWGRTYAGYLHTLPRLVAWLGESVPLAWVPALYAWFALVVNAAVVAYLVHRLRPWGLGLAAFAGVFLALTNGEIFGTLTNAQWFLQLFLLAACFIPAGARHRAVTLGVALLVALAALTGPFSLLLAALHLGLALLALAWPALRDALGRLHADGGGWRLAALWLGAGVQAWFLAGAGEIGEAAYSPALVLEALGTWTQGHLAGAAWLPAWLFLALLALMMVAALHAAQAREASLFLFVLMALALLEIAAASGKQDVIGMALGFGDRYFFLFKLGFWMLAFHQLGQLRFGRAGHAGWVALALCLGVAAMHPQALQRRPLSDKQWAQAVAPAEAGQVAKVPINPTPWTITVRPRD